jgi:hypothetical protein
MSLDVGGQIRRAVRVGLANSKYGKERYAGTDADMLNLW